MCLLISPTYTWAGEVRDHEVDLQGIVGNSNYLLYMQHARHQHFKQLGLDFVKMHLAGYDLVLVRSELDFKASLVSGDSFLVTSKVSRFGRVRFLVEQQVLKLPNHEVITLGKHFGTCLEVKTRRPVIPEQVKLIFDALANAED